MSGLRKAVLDKIAELGVVEASKFFGVSAGTISNWKNGRVDPTLRAVEMVYNNHTTPSPASQDPELVQWNGKEVVMLLPVYRSFNAYTHYTLFANYAKYGPDKIGMIIEVRTLIHEARNILVDKALKLNPRPKYVIFVDDDTILPCGNPVLFNQRYGANVSTESASFNAISRIMSHPPERRIVGGIYYGRSPAGKAQVCSAWSKDGGSAAYRTGKHKGLVAEDWVATGFMRIETSVFDEYKAAIDEGKFPECKPIKEGLPYGFFTPKWVGMGEDVAFGRRCAEIGIQSYADSSLICLHVGDFFYGPSNTNG